ncbi:MAG: hypothetical protein ABIZ72_03290, partial [Candidatus Limnocylindrales bacterium]
GSGPRVLRATVEHAARWNAGMATLAEVEDLRPLIDAACAAAGRDPATLGRSSEVLVRPAAQPSDEPREPNELRGSADEIAQAMLAYRPHGIGELQVQLRPNTLAAVTAFRPVIEAIRAG